MDNPFVASSRDTEIKGVDQIKHGESAYPAIAWVESQYNKPLDAEAAKTHGIPLNFLGVLTRRASNDGAHLEATENVTGNAGDRDEPVSGISNQGYDGS